MRLDLITRWVILSLALVLIGCRERDSSQLSTDKVVSSIIQPYSTCGNEFIQKSTSDGQDIYQQIEKSWSFSSLKNNSLPVFNYKEGSKDSIIKNLQNIHYVLNLLNNASFEPNAKFSWERLHNLKIVNLIVDMTTFLYKEASRYLFLDGRIEDLLLEMRILNIRLLYLLYQNNFIAISHDDFILISLKWRCHLFNLTKQPPFLAVNRVLDSKKTQEDSQSIASILDSLQDVIKLLEFNEGKLIELEIMQEKASVEPSHLPSDSSMTAFYKDFINAHHEHMNRDGISFPKSIISTNQKAIQIAIDHKTLDMQTLQYIKLLKIMINSDDYSTEDFLRMATLVNRRLKKEVLQRIGSYTTPFVVVYQKNSATMDMFQSAIISQEEKEMFASWLLSQLSYLNTQLDYYFIVKNRSKQHSSCESILNVKNVLNVFIKKTNRLQEVCKIYSCQENLIEPFISYSNSKEVQQELSEISDFILVNKCEVTSNKLLNKKK